jgi:hypothetical protein
MRSSDSRKTALFWAVNIDQKGGALASAPKDGLSRLAARTYPKGGLGSQRSHSVLGSRTHENWHF